MDDLALRLLIAALAGLLLGALILWARTRGPRRVADGDDGKTRRLLVFLSRDCDGCAAQRRTIETLRPEIERWGELSLIDALEEPERARALGVWTVPTTLIVAGSEVRRRFLEPLSPERLRRELLSLRDAEQRAGPDARPTRPSQ